MTAREQQARCIAAAREALADGSIHYAVMFTAYAEMWQSRVDAETVMRCNCRPTISRRGYPTWLTRHLMGLCKTVTPITPSRAPLADTSIVEQRNTNGVSHMFTSNTFESNLTAFIAAATLAALILSMVA